VTVFWSLATSLAMTLAGATGCDDDAGGTLDAGGHDGYGDDGIVLLEAGDRSDAGDDLVADAGPDLASNLRLAPAEFDFGAVPRFAVVTTMFVLRNAGPSTLQAAQFLISGDTAAFMLVGNDCQETLAPEQECHLEVFLRANVVGPHQGRLQVQAAGEQAVSSVVKGTVVASEAAP
jgi:hypothetical protein